MFEFLKKLLTKWFPKPKIDESNFNLLPSPLDLRDVRAEDIMGVSTAENPTPESVSCPYVLTQKEQGLKPICVGEVGATANEYEKRRQDLAIEFDPDWLYAECKKIDGIPDVKGTYFRAVLSVLKNKGAKPIGGLESDASKYKIGGYVQVDCIFDAIKRAIWKWGVVIMGFKVYSGGSWSSAYIKIPAGSQINGGHATIGKAFDHQFIRGQNSFGSDWGDKGDFYVPENYLPFECWAIVSDIPTTLLPNNSAKPVYNFTKNLFFGLNDPDVIQLQKFYKWNGCMPASVVESSNFGNRTYAATKIYQQRKGLPTTGNVYTMTLLAINNDLK